MITQFYKNRKSKKETIPERAAKLERDASELDFSAIGNMLCGHDLSDSEKKEVEKFNEQHDEMERLK